MATTTFEAPSGGFQPVLFDYMFMVDESPLKHYSLGGMREPTAKRQHARPNYVAMPGSDPLRVPHMSPRGASLLFGTTVESWVRNRISQYVGPDDTMTSEDGSIKFKFKRCISGSNPDGERRLTLPDIERLAYILYSYGQLDATATYSIVQACISIARLYDVQPPRKP